jgi:hypothetical protein
MARISWWMNWRGRQRLPRDQGTLTGTGDLDADGHAIALNVEVVAEASAFAMDLMKRCSTKQKSTIM